MLQRLKNIFKRKDKAIFHFKSELQSVDIYIHPHLSKNEKLHNSLVLEKYGYKISKECGTALFIRFLKYHGMWDAISHCKGFSKRLEWIFAEYGFQSPFRYYINISNQIMEIFPFNYLQMGWSEDSDKKLYKVALEWQKLMLSLNLIIK